MHLKIDGCTHGFGSLGSVVVIWPRANLAEDGGVWRDDASMQRLLTDCPAYAHQLQAYLANSSQLT